MTRNSLWPKPTKKEPRLKTMIKWEEEGFCKATDGCKVEPDGTCPHGHPSWMIYLGFI